MKLYGYHHLTGEYGGETQADRDPLGGGLLIPACTTQVPPPAPQDGKAIVWGGEAWDHVPDHRGEVWFDAQGRTVLIDIPGDPAASGFTPDPPPPVPSVATYSAALRALLDAKAQERGYDGILSAVSYADDPNPAYAAEGAALRAWRSSVYVYALAEMAKVEAAERETPSVEAFMVEVDLACPFEWPSAP
jgi:hypothetical protein